MITALIDDRQPGASVAFAIPRAVGPAVVRNRLRRRLRALIGQLDLDPGTYLVSATPAAASLGFEQLDEHLREACGR
jgi:ribonuclease P protein component